MDTLGPPLLQSGSDLDIQHQHMKQPQQHFQMHDDIYSASINGANGISNGTVNPQLLMPMEDTDNSHHHHEPEDETNSSTSSEFSSSEEEEDTASAANPLERALLPTGCCYDDRMKLHVSANIIDNVAHPEDPRRIEHIMRMFRKSGLIYQGSVEDQQKILKESPSRYMWRIQAREAEKDEICTVHTADHYDWVQSLAHRDHDELTALNTLCDNGRKSLYVGLCTPEAALIAAGGAIETCKHVVEGNVKNAIAIIRPPGHHAEAGESLGFCVFNNVPIAAKTCMQDYPDICRKVLILDWDIHHGNGTQDMFYEDPNVLYISLHVYDNGRFYPGQPDDPSTDDGGNDKVGRGPGLGKNVNIGWHSQGVGDAEYMAAFQQIVMPIAREFNPDLVIISAGFDAAAGDELGGCFVTPECYSQMTHSLMSLADGKVAVCLEGGYNLGAISRSALAVAKTLMGEPPSRLKIPPLNIFAAQVFEEVKYYQYPFWECMRSGVVDHNEARIKGATRLDGVIRNYQSNILSKNYQMVSLYIHRYPLSKSFEHQVMVTPLIHLAKKILVIFHDPPDLLASPDPMTAQVALHNAYVVDPPIHEYIAWAIENGIGVMDINIPLNTDATHPAAGSYPSRPGIVEYESKMKELVTYIWDNFIELYDSHNVILMGVGDSYLGIKQLLTSKECRYKVQGVLAFITGSLRPVKNEVDPTLSSWYKSNSEIYVTNKHACWDDAESVRKVKKQRFGKVMRSEETDLVGMLRSHQSRAKHWMLGKFGESLNDQPMTMGDAPPVTIDGEKPMTMEI